jgi:predicted SAM-dependent methyltransferase
MFHHSLEHMPDQVATLRTASELLAPGGMCLVRIPTVSSYAWKHYGSNWAQCDAPRHLFLHSKASLHLVATAAGFELVKVIYDSTEFQFWASEQYIRDTPLWSEDSYAVNPSRSGFSREVIESFRRRADELNRQEQGDQAVFVLRKPSNR